MTAIPHARPHGGVIRAALAPLYAEPHVLAAQISQIVMGAPLAILDRQDAWLHVRCDDNYTGWVHAGYVLTHDNIPARNGALSVLSLGAELCDSAGTVFTRLPWGARLRRVGAVYHLPDGRAGRLHGGEMIDARNVASAFPRCAEAVARTAFRWLGAPYLWGGVTPAGVDCSGFVQAIFRIHGVLLPRDARLQWSVGETFQVRDGFADLRPADLLFFGEPANTITHVALSLGGSTMIHAALGNGGVDLNDLTGELELDEVLRRTFAGVRRVLCD